MEGPTYHLEGVVKSREEMQDFSGPLSLILSLLSKNKIEIRDIQVSVILDQFLEYMDEMRELDLEIASEFVQMASYLVYIKTKMLLSGDEEVSELGLLIASLEQMKSRESYSRIKLVTEELLKASENGMLLFAKPAEHLAVDKEYKYRHEIPELLRAIASVFSRAAYNPEPNVETIRTVTRPIVFGVREKSRQLVDWLKANGRASLRSLYMMSESRTELVATFISILELCGAGHLTIAIEGEDLLVTYAGGDAELFLRDLAD